MKLSIRVVLLLFLVSFATGCTINIGDLSGGSQDDNNQATEETQNEADAENLGENENITENQVEEDNTNHVPVNDDEEKLDVDDEIDIGDEGDVSGDEFVAENEAFKIYEPAPNASVQDQIIVRGMASVFEATVQYSFEDGHFIIDSGFTTASEGGPGWGEFEIIIDLTGVETGDYRVVLYESSAQDGSILHELIIPVHVNK